ncbi:Uncharacterised protein [Staphylococcus aureus]|nr:Uncharacterised protein [Staphylococcus aureus]
MTCSLAANGTIGSCFPIESNTLTSDKFFVDVTSIGYNGAYNNAFLNGASERNIKLIAIFDPFENPTSTAFSISKS